MAQPYEVGGVSRDRELRERLVEYLEGSRVVTDPALITAFQRVPRHAFIPEVGLEEAYEDRALAIKERDGVAISSISQPSMIAQMLALLDVHPGQRVLEIGTGSGYHAALLTTLVGNDGYVLTVDIEDDLIARARAVLAQLEFRNVDVAHASTMPMVNHQFERIVVTARADDIHERWWDLLAEDGRIVAPLDIGYGGERAIGFARNGRLLHSIGLARMRVSRNARGRRARRRRYLLSRRKRPREFAEFAGSVTGDCGAQLTSAARDARERRHDRGAHAHDLRHHALAPIS